MFVRAGAPDPKARRRGRAGLAFFPFGGGGAELCCMQSFTCFFCVCVCVCPPLDKGLFTTTSFPPNLSRGVWHSRPTTRNEAVGGSGKQGLISPAYLLVSPQAVTPIFHFLIHGRLHDTSHKPTRPQQLRRRLSADVQRCSAERGKLC